jgi:hypothetical protein
MSITAQLHRGCLALPLLLLFATLAGTVVLGRGLPSPTVAVADSRSGICGSTLLRLRRSSAPGDLPLRSARLTFGCRG